MSKKQTRRTLYIALSVLFAVIIWVFVDLADARPVEKTFSDLPIVYENEDDLANQGLMLLPEGTTSTLDLTLKGTRWDISNVDRDDITVTVKLTDITATGSQLAAVTISFPNISKFSRALEPSMATVNIAELYSKTVEVQCDVTGNVAEGYTAEPLQLSHTAIEIRGQKEDIDPVSYVKTTLDLGENAEATVSEALSYQFCGRDGSVIDNSDGRIHTTVETIQATLPVSVQKELTLRMNFIESAGARVQNVDYEIRPATIPVSGDAAKLKSVNAITLADFDLLSLEDGVATYTYPITVPEGCQNTSGVTRATLTISWKDMASAEITTDQFQCVNVPEGKSWSVLTRETTVTVFGTAEDVAAITGEDLTLVADLSNYGSAAGSYTLPATVKIGNGGDIGVSGTYQIQVTIREDTGETPPEDIPEE